MAELKLEVRRVMLPDQVHCFEMATYGMKVTCRVIQLCGSFERTREIYETNKGTPHWLKYVAGFESLAKLKYVEGIFSTANRHKSGS